MSLDALRNACLRYPISLGSRLRILWLRALGMKIGRRCRLVKTSVPRNPWDIVLQEGVALDDGVVLLTTGDRQQEPRIVIGRYTYMNRHVFLDATERILIGAECMIGPFCYITDHDHGSDVGASFGVQPLVSAPTVIGNDVWLGAAVCVLKGVTIGDGSIVGAGSVVTRDIPSGSIAMGVPARVTTSRCK